MEEQLDKPTYYQTSLSHVRADRVYRTIISQQLEPFKLNLMEWLMLGVINDASKAGITLSKIAEALDVSQPQVTALMTSVSNQGLVRQKTLRQDRRSRSVVLSVRGLRLLDKIEETINAYMDQWLSQVPPDQYQAYLEIMGRMSQFKAD